MTNQTLATWNRAVPIVFWIVVAALYCGTTSLAQDQEVALYDRQPFDRIVAKGGGPNSTVEVQPLDIPNRRVPNPFPSGTLKYRLSDSSKGTGEYEIPWTRIERVELFENMLLAEGRQLTLAGEFDKAYDYYAALLRRFPNAPGLEAALNEYLQRNASAAVEAKEFDRALAILGSLYDRDPQSRNLGNAIDKVANKIIEQYLENKDYKSARLTLDVVARNFPKLQLKVVNVWRTQFQQSAATQIEVARTALAAGEFTEARAAIDEAVGVWPEITGSEELRRQIQQANPQVSVGVFETSPSDPTYRLDSWPHRRAAVLVEPLLAELVDYSPEGGVYRSPVGEISTDAAGLVVTITIKPREGVDDAALAVGVSALARDLLRAASGDHPAASPALAELVDDVVVLYPAQVRLKLAHPHVRPEALLRIPVPEELRKITNSIDYKISKYDENETIFSVPRDRISKGGMAEVREVRFNSEESAIAALMRGDVDVIDRVPPWQVDRLRKAPGVVVSMYKLPTVHALVPTQNQPLLERREFRRALCYALDREMIVNRILLGGETRSGYQVVSGPFAARDSLTVVEPYAYNASVRPRDYDIQLASMLLTVAWTSVQPKVPKEQEQPPTPPLPELVLAHGSDPATRAACQAIKKQLAPLGLNVKLVEMSADQLTQPDLEGVDLRYVELTAWEPVTDARDLLGVGGALGAGSDFLVYALDDLDAAINWNDVRTEMFSMHQIAASELPLIPLWQTRNYLARREFVDGIQQETVTLYQDIDRWKMNFE